MSEYLVDINHERLSFFTPAGEVKMTCPYMLRKAKY